MAWQNGFRDKNGVTLLELMVVLAIIVILLGAGYLSFKQFKANYDLTNATNQLYADFQWVRQRSMGSTHLYGIAFAANGYTVFEDTNDDQSYNVGVDRVIKAETFTNISLAGFPASNQVVYTRRGTPNSQFTLTLSNQYGKTKQIAISQFRVRIQ